MRLRTPYCRSALAAAAAVLLGACAQLPQGDNKAAASATAVAPAASAPAAAATATAAAPATPGARPPAAPPGPPPFATVIKDARRIDGPVTLWQKDEKVWIELLPAQLGQPFLLSPKIRSGISEAWVLGGLMGMPINGAGGAQLVEFVRVHNQVRLQARNTEVTAAAGTPEARAVADSYAHSLLASAPVVSQPHPDRKSVLVEANGIFLGDMMGIGMMLQRGLRQGYALDRSNTVFTSLRVSADGNRRYASSGVSKRSGRQPARPASPTRNSPRHIRGMRASAMPGRLKGSSPAQGRNGLRRP